MCVYVSMHVCMWGHTCHDVPVEITLGNCFFASAMWDLGLELM